MENKYLTTGFLHIILSIVLGAFGAHALREVFDVKEMESFKTAVQYQQFHGLALLLLPAIQKSFKFESKWGMRLLFSGIFCFSYSIYFLLLLKKLEMGYGFLIPITPIGGTLLIVGWSLLFASFLARKGEKE